MAEALSGFSELLHAANDWLYSCLLVLLLLAAGLYFTARCGFPQLRLLAESVRVVGEKKAGPGATSSFEALMVSTGARVGTGNIAGIATAVALGGPGSVFWMWVIAVISGASAFVESTLAQVYKKRDNSGFRGGPAYYIRAALHSRFLSALFALLLIAAYALGFNALQAFNIVSALQTYPFYQPGRTPLLAGAVLAALTMLCIRGGAARAGRVTAVLTPLMAVSYILLSLYITMANIELLPQVFATVLRDAFDLPAIFSGFAGSCVVYGVRRGLFSHEAGIGSAPNAAAAADVSHPVKQGLVQMLSVFIDTFLICTSTAFLLLFSGVEAQAGMAGLPYVQAAAQSQLGNIGVHFITIAVFLFAFTSILGDYYYAEANLRLLDADGSLLASFRLLAALAVFLGAQLDLQLAWDLTDFLMACMAMVNLPVICLLGKTARACLADYEAQRRAGKNPVFHAAAIGVKNTDCWR